MRPSSIAALLLLFLPTTARAQMVAPDPAEGQQIAAKLCSNCHVVNGNGAPAPRGDVPSFRSIANGPRSTPEALAAAIILPHPEMPGIALTRDEIRHVIAYIVSLKK